MSSQASNGVPSRVSPDTSPSLDIHDYKTQNTFDHIIPKCENATAGQLCY